MIADRWNRRKIVIATQTASMILAFILAFLTLSEARSRCAEVIVLAALMGVVNAVDIPARQAFLVEMVGREDLMNAIALNSSMFNGARMIGPSIAGILVAEHRRRLVLFRQRRQLYRGDRRTADDARGAQARLRTWRRRSNISPKGFASSGTPRRSARSLLLVALVSLVATALRRADADFCGEDSARQRADAGRPDGRDRNGSA